MQTQGTSEAAKRTWKKVVRFSAGAARRAKAFAERHPGVTAGVAGGYALGCIVEKVPGTQLLGRLPRYGGAVTGAVVGLVFEKTLAQVQAEMRTAEAPCGNLAD